MTSSEAINVAVSGEGQKGHSNRVGERVSVSDFSLALVLVTD